jgi:glycerol-3-phosphate dehydrogenase subunit B
VVGIPTLRDFHASLCAANLAQLGLEARAVEVALELARPENNAVGLAGRFDDPAFRAAFAAELAPRLRSSERVAMPAVLGLRDPHGAWSELEQRLGRPVFEIPTLPPSAPGIRVYDALRAAVRRAGGKLVLGATATAGVRQGERVSAVRVRVSGHEVLYRCGAVVLATGGLHSGGIELSADWRVRETVLDLPLRGAPDPGEPRFVPDYFAPQPLARVGVAVGPQLQALGTSNVFVAGAGLPGAEPWREGSGEGIALASAHAAVAGVLKREGAEAAA